MKNVLNAFIAGVSITIFATKANYLGGIEPYDWFYFVAAAILLYVAAHEEIFYDNTKRKISELDK